MVSKTKRGKSISKSRPAFIFPAFILIFAILLVSILYVLVPPLFGKVAERVDYRGPIAYYNFESRGVLGDDVAGIYDASCDPRTGRICPQYVTVPKDEGAADFSGRENRQLVLGTPISLPGSFTVMFKVHHLGGGTIIWGPNGGITIDPGNSRIQFTLQGSGFAASEPVPSRSWTHYTLIRNLEGIRIYKNGVLESGQFDVDGSLTIDTLGFSTTHGNLQGILDNLKIFDYPLLEWQIRNSGGLPGIENTVSLCRDTFDNDNDGQVNCADENCQGLAVGSNGERCEFSRELSCMDDFDNDGDGARDGQDRDCKLQQCSATDSSLVWVWSYLPTENPSGRPARIGCCAANQCQSERVGCVNNEVNPNPTTICGDANNWDTCSSRTDPYPDSSSSTSTATIKHQGDLSDGRTGYCDGSQWRLCTAAAEDTLRGSFRCSSEQWETAGVVDVIAVVEICADGIDNDRDGMIDEGCAAQPQPEICGNDIDDDGDGIVNEGCAEQLIAETCGDGIDNDRDGMIDEGCAAPPQQPAAEVCSDGIDNDQDGTVDENCPVATQPVTQPTSGRQPIPAMPGGTDSETARTRTTESNQTIRAERGTCEESWVCREWSSCQEGIQKRICVDEHACGSTLEKPSMERECMMPPEIKKPEPSPPDLQKPSSVGKYVAWGSGIAVFIAAVTALIAAGRRKNKKKK